MRIFADLEKLGDHAFGFYNGNKLYLLKLKDGKLASEHGVQEHSDNWNGMDVSVLHNLILDRYLGINQGNIESHIKYTRDNKLAIEKVDKGEYMASFMMNAPPMSDLTSVAANKEKMPQKSTYFYPKLVTGFAFMKLDDKNI